MRKKWTKEEFKKACDKRMEFIRSIEYKYIERITLAKLKKREKHAKPQLFRVKTDS